MEKSEAQEAKTFVVDINLTRRWVTLLSLALLTAAFLGYLAWGQGKAVASNPQAPLAASTGLRQYYITTSHHNGADADTACASGYHMAALWEILDTTNLEYNTALGQTEADSGQGPPTCSHGWVRTGYYSDNSNTPGVGNCNSWTSSDGGDYGTVARLPCDWTQTQHIHVWQAWTETCDWPSTVWCVADKIGTFVYLPLVLRNH